MTLAEHETLPPVACIEKVSLLPAVPMQPAGNRPGHFTTEDHYLVS